MNLVFANQNEEDSSYPLTTREIVEAQQQDNYLNKQADKEGFPPSWSKIEWLITKSLQ